jgi:type III restriction enzyme
VQAANGVSVSDALIALETSQKISPNAEEATEAACPYNFSVEMETGTGKTYTFIKTIYELHKKYGFKKFVIVVPSVAIREGTMKNLAITRDHFGNDYDHVPCIVTLYDSSKPNLLKDFSEANNLSVLVMSIDSFTKDNNKINQAGERLFAPIKYLQSTKPIVIVDEPQNFDTDIRRNALMNLHPLCTLRYSATLDKKHRYNVLYTLNPVQAYELGLVKQIQVDGLVADANHNEAFIELLSITRIKNILTAKVCIDVEDKNGVKRKTVTLKERDNVYQKSGKRAAYEHGYQLEELNDNSISFSNGQVLSMGQAHGERGLADDIARTQIERTVRNHFERLANLKPMGIKVLSLFFIDKVANYRAFDEEGNASLGKFGVWFEAAFQRCAKMEQYRDLIPHGVSDVHGGYFSGDKKGKGTAATTTWVDTKGNVEKDNDTYALIMKDKERLLSLDTPLQFIFSHSALREGWDNPNVFQICTLNETKSTDKKRQELGRGLRLCVNQHGERVIDKGVNVLTVIANESYDSFAKSLQTEIEEDCGVAFDKRGIINLNGPKVRITKKTLNAEEQALFNAIWAKINYQTTYRVKLDTPRVIADCVKALSDFSQYPKVVAPKIRSERAKFTMQNDGIQTTVNATAQMDSQQQHMAVPDVYAYLQNRVHLSRSSLFNILHLSGRLGELFINPQAFLDTAIAAIKNTLQALMVEGIEYKKINGKVYEMSLFDANETKNSHLVYPPDNGKASVALTKTLFEAQALTKDELENYVPIGEPFACVLPDSEVESRFAQDCSTDGRVKFFFKLPSSFKIPTPLGSYNPDWAVVFEGDARVYFVAETKSSLLNSDLRASEKHKIACGQHHFKLSAEVSYCKVTSLEELGNIANSLPKQEKPNLLGEFL